MPKTTKEIKEEVYDYKLKIFYCSKCRNENCCCEDLWFSQSEVDEIKLGLFRDDELVNNWVTQRIRESLDLLRKELCGDVCENRTIADGQSWKCPTQGQLTEQEMDDNWQYDEEIYCSKCDTIIKVFSTHNEVSNAKNR